MERTGRTGPPLPGIFVQHPDGGRPELSVGDVPDDAVGESPAAKSLRAQMLATEHWSLLASRSTTQAEILTRIAIFLTLVSAGLVTLGILGQATAFGDTFSSAACGVLGFLLLVGVLTQVRVTNAMTEDLMYVLGMNRLRGGYADLDPGVERYFLASVNDDDAGVGRTYYFFGNRDVTQVLGSSGMFIVAVNSVLAGLLAGFLTHQAGAATSAALAVGGVVLVVALVASMSLAYRMYRRLLSRISPLRATPGGV